MRLDKSAAWDWAKVGLAAVTFILALKFVADKTSIGPVKSIAEKV